MVTICVGTVGAQTEWDCSTTTGVFKRSTDCTISNQIVVTGKLNVIGVPDAQGNLPKLISGGSNRLFKVNSGGELVVKYLNMTGGGITDRGGAVHSSGSFNAINASFSNNHVSLYGGAVHIASGSTAVLENTTFDRNTGSKGGAVMIYGSKRNIVDMIMLQNLYSKLRRKILMQKIYLRMIRMLKTH